MPAVKKHRIKQNMTEKQRVEIGRLIIEDGWSTEKASKEYGCGYSTAGACATNYRRKNKKKVAPKPAVGKKPNNLNKAKRYSEDFKTAAVEAFYAAGGKQEVMSKVAETLGVSRAAISKWVEKHGSGFKNVEAPAEEKPIVDKDHRTPSQELEIIKDHARSLTIQVAEQMAKIISLQEELEMLKPLARKYLKL